MVQQRYLRLSRLLAIFLVLAMSIVTPVGIADADSLRDSFTLLEESDTTPPAFKADSPSPWPQSEGSRMVGVTVLTEEAAYYHLVLLPEGAAPPNKDQVMAGTDGNGNPALKTMHNNSKTSSITVSMFVDEHSTDYDIYIVLRDDAGNLSEPAKVDVRSPDGAQLIKGDGIRCVNEDEGSRQIRVEVSLQNIKAGYKGKVYWVLLPWTQRNQASVRLLKARMVTANPLSQQAVLNSIRQT